ncbi:hypothetical protein T310_8661, partial [Rasamsonia emersonii CBS 393.64]
ENTSRPSTSPHSRHPTDGHAPLGAVRSYQKFLRCRRHKHSHEMFRWYLSFSHPFILRFLSLLGRLLRSLLSRILSRILSWLLSRLLSWLLG